MKTLHESPQTIFVGVHKRTKEHLDQIKSLKVATFQVNNSPAGTTGITNITKDLFFERVTFGDQGISQRGKGANISSKGIEIDSHVKIEHRRTETINSTDPQKPPMGGGLAGQDRVEGNLFSIPIQQNITGNTCVSNWTKRCANLTAFTLA
jgi:hypothetical protein